MSGVAEGGVVDERRRLAQLEAYGVLDTPAERDFDDIARLAAAVCETPIALVSFVSDTRQWFKAVIGLDVSETAREHSFCAAAMHLPGVLEVHDAREDPRFATNVLVVGEPHIRFYAGAPLVSPSGQPLGSLCVIDRVPRRLTATQRLTLTTLSRQVIAQLELREHAARLKRTAHQIEQAGRLGDEFLARINHEVRTPVTSIHGYLEILQEAGGYTEEADRFLGAARRNADRLLALVDDTLTMSQLSTSTLALSAGPVDLAALAQAAGQRHGEVAQSRGLTLQVVASGPVPAVADARLLAAAFDHLVGNALKFTAAGGISLAAGGSGDRAWLEVTDTGVGIPDEEITAVLAPFTRGVHAERAEAQGPGLGLAIACGIAQNHGGAVTLESTPGTGTTARIWLPTTG